MAGEALDKLSLSVQQDPISPMHDSRNRGVQALLGSAEIALSVAGYGSSIPTDKLLEPEAEPLASAGWTELQSITSVTFYDPELTRKAVREQVRYLGPALEILEREVGLSHRLLAAKRIGLKYVTDEVDIDYLPEDLVDPKDVYLTLALTIAEDNGYDLNIEGREHVEQIKAKHHHRESQSYSMYQFFRDGHVGIGRPVSLQVLSDNEIGLFHGLFDRFRAASQAVAGAAVSDTFSITPPEAGQLWTPGAS